MLRLTLKYKSLRLSSHVRTLHDGGIWGYQTVPPLFVLPDFTEAELANRVRNAPLLRLVESFRRHGHRGATLDPLNLAERAKVPALDPRRYGLPCPRSGVRDEFASETLPRESAPLGPEGKFDTTGIMDFPPGEERKMRSIEEIVERLEEVYCGGVGYEFMHLPSKDERRFLETFLERSHSMPIPPAKQLEYFHLLRSSENFDAWLAKKFPAVKRYGLEGAEGMMVALSVAIEEATKNGVEEVVLAMPHRGRLNVLTQLLGLDMRVLVRKMRGLPTLPPSLPSSQFSDDVLSHLFLSSNPPLHPNMLVHLLPNPSHLETVTPVGMGFARALQVPFHALASQAKRESYELGDKVLSLQVHGDAAFGGQGVVAETLNLTALPHFNCGGSIRLVVNNQLGYTTPGTQGRTSFYATDLAKSIAAPVLHVNGDRIDDVARAVSMAMSYRDKFRKDLIIDLVVYRRRGHNELDEPSFTSPLMYRKISELPSVANLYETTLLNSGVLDPTASSEAKKSQLALLDTSLVGAEPANFTVPELPMLRGWDEMRWPVEGEWETENISTGVQEEILEEVGRRSVATPVEITVHPRLIKMHMAKRLQNIDSGEGIDFATAEALAFGSLMLDGKHVRLCGQDSGRGTFSQRHAILCDQNSKDAAVPLQSLTTSPPPGIAKRQAPGTIEVVNSPLSEYAVVGFEQGFAYVSPHILPIWEAQFGDFFNTAQVVFDTYLGSGESKWGMQSALTLLLPHGLDSAGPEHSSARIERFLQLTNEPLSRQAFVPNLHLVNVTTPANYFHVLRRQLKREYRKPLVVFSPKGILRLPAASSTFREMSEGTFFQPVIDDPSIQEPEGVNRVVFLSGKGYYDFVKVRSDRGFEGKVALVRVEEISPFPYARLLGILSRYPNATSHMWAQEEPENAGSLLFVTPRFQQILAGRPLALVSRPAMACPAPGVSSYFAAQKEKIYEGIFEGL